MIDLAAVRMHDGLTVACERIAGRNDNMTQSHFHDFYEIYVLESGTRRYVIEDQLFDVNPGDLVLLPPHTMHHSFSAPGADFKRVVIYFTPAGAGDALYREALQHRGIYRIRDPRTRPAIQSLIEALVSERDDVWAAPRRQAHLVLLLTALWRDDPESADPVSRDRLQDLLNYIGHHYMDDLSLDDLAARFCLSKFSLCRHFRNFTHSTVVSYINSVRVLNARRLFLESDLNLSEIAREVGFNSLNHFERTFFHITGQKPGAALRAVRGLRRA